MGKVGSGWRAGAKLGGEKGYMGGGGRNFIPSWDSFPADHGIEVPLPPTEQNYMHD